MNGLQKGLERCSPEPHQHPGKKQFEALRLEVAGKSPGWICRYQVRQVRNYFILESRSYLGRQSCVNYRGGRRIM